MKEFIDSVKALGEKMTGKEVEGTELVDVVDDITEKYEGGGQGGGAVGCAYLTTNFDLKDLLLGKHLDVTKFFSLCEKYDINLNGTPAEGELSVTFGNHEQPGYTRFLYLFSDSCSGGLSLHIGNTQIQIEETEVEQTYKQILEAYQNEIENVAIDISFDEDAKIYFIYINGGPNSKNAKFADLAEIIK